jgi:hypothetical protein
MTIRRGGAEMVACWPAAEGLGVEATTGGAGAATEGRATRGEGGTEAAAGGATAIAGRCGGAFFAAASALRRSRIALSASPGLETFERSNLGFAGAADDLLPLPRPPFLKYSRTRSAWSGSIELECVFPDTPMASSASRMGLLFTSSSLAKSLIRTFVIRPFSLPCAASCSYEPRGSRNMVHCLLSLKSRSCEPVNVDVRGRYG